MSKTSPATLSVLLVTFVGSILLGTAGADGNVGCMYEDVCIKKIEWCFDDGAFGRCLPSTPAEDDLYRYNLNYSDLQKLKTILQDIRANNFDWKNSYAQCLIQAQLYAIKLKTEFSGQICSHLMLQHYEDPIRKLKEFEKLHPEGPVGIRRSNYLFHSKNDKPEYNTNNNWPNYKLSKDRLYNTFEKARNELDNDLAGQLIALPLSNKNNPSRKRKRSHENNTHARFRGTPLYMPKHLLMTDKAAFKKMERENEQLPIFAKTIKNSYYPLDNVNVEPADYNEDDIDEYKLNGLIDEMNQLSKSTTYTEGGPIYLDKSKNFNNNLYSRLLDDYESDFWGFRRSERLDVKKPGPYFKVNNYAFQNMNKQFKADGSGADLTDSAYRFKPDNKEPNVKEHFSHTSLREPPLDNFQNPEYTYVPGTSEKTIGNIFPKFSYVYIRLKEPIPEKSPADIVNIISSQLNVPKHIFADVKLNGKNLLFEIIPNKLGITALSVQKGIDEVKEMIAIPVLFADVGDQSVFSAYNDLDNVDYDDSRDKKEDNVDPVVNANRLIYMDVNNTSLSWQSANRILDRIETLMGIKRNTFKLLNVDGGTITFEIVFGNGEKKLDNVKVSADIEAIRDDLKAENITIISVEPISEDDYTDGPLSIPLQNPKGFLYVLTISMCILLGAVFVLAVAFGFVKKHSRATDKLKKLNNPSSSDVEHSKDYQLCRARMAEKPPEISSHVGHRITSISRESDNSPSSRSSTSSWSEEPIYNIDISTGHAFMAYMESHLQNEGRLDAEWVALCAYEAEPSETSVAHQPENRNKNRYINAVPYDHARIRLNALSNVSGSDYINASPIYDTDPRAPAYIATQGPLPETTIDFWQMVWEQGSVIIVMLTRLVENDITMCHRYWPRETTEIYGIYDIHLVSEHMWDDDHLVRSFYLRNIKTTETRTVTQFHFLLWPEGGIPAINRTLLDFRRKVNKSFRGRSCPIIVHCSDGCGRSGTYILLDMVLNRICKGAKEIDIAATLEHIRDQRSGTVSTKAQFEFVLEAVAEEVNTILQSIPQPQLSHDLQRFDEIPRPSQQPATDNSVAASSSTTSQCTVIEEEPTTTSSNGLHDQAKTEDDTSKQIKGEKK